MLINEIDNYIKEATKERIKLVSEGNAEKLKDIEATLDIYRVIKGELSRLKNKKPDMTEVDEAGLILNMVNTHKENIAIYTGAGRTEMADKEARELAALAKFEPEVPSDDELREFTAASISAYLIAKEPGYKLSMRDMKPIMEIVKTRYAMADGKVISEEVRKVIGG